MLSSAAGKASNLTQNRGNPHTSGSVMARKIWVPKLLYDSLPYFYLASGVAAFFATLYINQWFWVLPHYVLFSAACLHLGIVVYRRRHRKRQTEKDAPP